ncbi:PREDICTED: bypass of stop codon protein 1-like, partial [Rhagoletis zephyria]
MHFFQVALFAFGLAAVALQASGNPQGSDHSYQLFNKQRTNRGRRTHDHIGTGRVISQDLLNRITSLKGSTSTTTTTITTTSTFVPSSPTTGVVTLFPTTSSSSPTTTSPTTPTSITTVTTNAS